MFCVNTFGLYHDVINAKQRPPLNNHMNLVEDINLLGGKEKNITRK